MQLKALHTLDYCPHCHAIHPHLLEVWHQPLISIESIQKDTWIAYLCESCDGIITDLKPGNRKKN